MFKFILSLFYIFVHSILVSSPDVTPTDYDSSKYLSRYFSVDEEALQTESCRYYSMTSTISFNGDKVFSPDYEKLNTEIKMHIKVLESPSNLSGYKVTLMSIILSATGKNQSGKIKRVYDKIYVKEEDDGTPTILTDQEKGSKILVFSSNNSDYFKYKDFRKNSTTFYKNGAYELFNLSSLEGKDNHDIKSKYNEFYKNKNNSSHAEPLWLATLLTLSQDTFQQLLPTGYALMYY